MKARQALRSFPIQDVLTFSNALAGLGCITLTLRGEAGAALVMLAFAVIFDSLDGRISRARSADGVFGRELDSLADIVSFGVAPCVLGISTGGGWPLMIAVATYLVAGIYRLARFNSKPFTGFYEGLPITTAGILFPAMFLLKFPSWPLAARVAVFLILAFLMASRITIPKCPFG